MATVPGLQTILEEVRERARTRQAQAGDRHADAARHNLKRPLRASLEADAFAVIAEIKRASPSAGAIRPDLTPAQLAQEYATHGARGISVLTCEPYFGGRQTDLTEVKQACGLPILCKDFIVSEFQIEEAAAYGADAILLIAAALSDEQLQHFSESAKALQLEILYEAHDAAELNRLLPLNPELLGINSRNLKTMTVDPHDALQLGSDLPVGSFGIFESGVKTAADAKNARAAGFRAALIGEALLRAESPGRQLREILGGVSQC